jgi:quinol monooxygenase YgiN
MIIRLVKMSFKPEEVENFLALFETVKTKIRAREGCTHLALWQQKDQPNVMFTYSM